MTTCSTLGAWLPKVIVNPDEAANQLWLRQTSPQKLDHKPITLRTWVFVSFCAFRGQSQARIRVFSRLIRIHCTPIHRHSLPKSVGLLHLCVLVCCENGLGLSNFSILASFIICCGPMVGLARWTDFESYRYRHLGAQQTLARPRTTCLKIDG